MYLRDNPPMIYTPSSLVELFQIYDKIPSAQIIAGGTWILGTQSQKFIKLNRNALSLEKIGELKKIRRTERYIEFGSCVTLAQVLNLKASLIPSILHDAIQEIATVQVRNRATLGGNLSVKGKRMSLFPLFLILDAKIELRKTSSSRWIDFRRYINEKNLVDINENEILTRIRIPIEEWQIQKYNSIGNRMELDSNFQVNAYSCKINKDQIIDIRSVFINGESTIFRPLQTEGNIIGNKLPLTEKENKELLEIFKKELNSNNKNMQIYEKENFIRLFESCLSNLASS